MDNLNKIPEPEIHLIITPRKKRNNAPKTFSITMTIFGFLFLGLSLIKTISSINSKTSAATVAEKKQAQLANVLGIETQSSVIKFRSEGGDFQFEYNPIFWSVESQSPENVTMVLKRQYGSANFSLKKLSSYKTLDSATADIIKNSSATEDITGKLVDKEKTSFNSFDAYKLTFQHSILGYNLLNYQYVVKSQNNYYLITEGASSLLNSKPYLDNLNSSITFLTPGEDSNILGASTTNATGDILSEAQITALVKPSVVNIVHLYCQTINIGVSTPFMKPSYKICSGMKGSGFVVNESGYIATNGHIVKVYPEEMMIISFLDGHAVPFLVDLIKEVTYEKTGTQLTDNQATQVLTLVNQTPGGDDSLLSAMYTLYDSKVMTINDLGSTYYVRMGDQPFQIDNTKIDGGNINDAVTVTNSVLSAQLVAFDYPNSFTSQSLVSQTTPAGSDVGLLKVDNPNGYVFPALKLGDSSTLTEGTQILIVGYPGLVDSTSNGSDLLSYQSSVEPTITNGIISSIKSAQDGKKLFQTDASIDHGNSGGPAFNNQGQVIGIASYGFQSSSGNYNFLRDVKDLQALMTANGITSGDSLVYDNWQSALNRFWVSKYKNALPLFNKVKTNYPIHPTVDQYISDSNTAIANHQDKSGFFSSIPILSNIPSMYLIFGAIGFVLLLGGAITTIIIVNKKYSSEDIEPKQPVIQMQPLNSQPALPIQQQASQTSTIFSGPPSTALLLGHATTQYPQHGIT